jgi:DNA-binding XRE family transcriptional regulator
MLLITTATWVKQEMLEGPPPSFGGKIMERGMKPRELREIRERMGLTQEQLATELGVHRLSVNRWEVGVHRIPLMLTLAIKQLETRLPQTQFSQNGILDT